MNLALWLLDLLTGDTRPRIRLNTTEPIPAALIIQLLRKQDG